MKNFLQLLARPLCGLLLLAALPFAFAAPAEGEEALLPGDTIRITVFDNPDLATETRISARGGIRFPLIGDVRVGGLSLSAAAERIAARLREGQFIRQPQVSVHVVQERLRQVSVLGQVSRPGRYAIDDTGTTLTDVLALAGGIAAGGDDTVTVIRTRDGRAERLEIDVQRITRDGDLAANLAMERGDTVFVPRAPVFYLYGEVQRAGIYRLEPRTSVMHAISAGGGITPRGTERGLRISRRAADGTLTRIDAQLGDPVRADDIIQVGESLF